MNNLSVPLSELGMFNVELELARPKLTKQEYRTLRGQALHGDIEAAAKGLSKILGRLNKKEGSKCR